MNRIALITGVTGQSGAYLSAILLQKGYRVVGTTRQKATASLCRLEELGVSGDIELIDFDLLDLDKVSRTIEKIQPQEIYNFAAQSSVGISFDRPVDACEAGGLGVVRLLESVRRVNSKIRFYQASTSEMFGQAQESPQNETTPFLPRSPYAIAKLFAHLMTVNYRESYGMHASSGILFNNESPLRNREFVTRKITLSLALVKHGKLDTLELGNLNASRDWGFAGDYVFGSWCMLQQSKPDDYVFATGQTHTVRQFVHYAASAIGLNLQFAGEGIAEHAIDAKSGRVVMRVNPKFYRPTDLASLIGDSSKARRVLGWKSKMSFEELVVSMAEADERRVRDGQVRV